MKAQTLRIVVAPLLVTLLLGACTLGRTRSASTLSPREQSGAAMMPADVQTLRHENAQMRQRQEAMQARLDELNRTLAQNQEDQKRFRESMTTNFDLLEQSVALTLSKTITADMAAKPAQPAAMAAAASGNKAQPAARSLIAGPMQAAAPSPAAQPGPAPRPAAARSAEPVAAMPVAMPSAAETAPVEDPDLLPPQHPTLLSAHQEAKALYEKGFALFARKDYDQAVIVFQNFLTRFPDDIYSDNAQFWIAESYMGMSRSNEAETAYRNVLRNYEHRSTLEGYKTPDAIYRLGQLYQNRGDQRRAQHFFAVLGERFPDTSAGRKAQRELAAQGVNTAAR